MIVIPVQSASELLPPEHASSTSRLSNASASQRRAPKVRSSSVSSSRSSSLTPDEDANVSAPSFGKLSKDIARDFGRLYEAVAGARRIVVVCEGAGISVSAPANIPDFRSSSGLFQKLKDQHPNAGLTSGKDLFDARLFNSEKTSDLFYTMIAELKEMADRAQPTAFHHFLKKLDTEGRLLRVYTQNIDGLEERAGLTFGLAAGPATGSTVALGKRKREEVGSSARLPAEGPSAARRAVWSRTQSDSALLWSDKASGKLASGKSSAPMFPRTIPLHGSLNSMTCGRCGHQEILENAFKSISERLAEYEEYRLKVSEDRQDEPESDERLSTESTEDRPKVVPELRHLDVTEVLRSLRAGEHIACPRCETADEVRLAAGLRSRGVGRMKPDVVLYGGQNDGAERVGECLSRDILGLRDPNETQVPETIAEIRAKERRALKETERAMTISNQTRSGAEAAPVDSDLSVGVGQSSQEETLAAMFLAEEDQASEEADRLAPLITDLAPAPGLSQRNSGVGNGLAKTTSKSKPKKQLKPLPPDLLIVAGTSLKVSGTKRIIREFAKACRARDYRYYPGDDSSDEADSTAGSRPSTPRRRLRKRSASPDEEEEDETEDEDDPKAPIRTILLNYEFPSPSSQWEDVFDMWIQGDVQKAARGLWPMTNTNSAFSTLPLTDEEEEMINVAARLAGVNAAESWAHLKDHLDEQRALEKRYKGKSAAASKRKAKEEEAMPPKLVALSLNTLGALTSGSAKPVPLPQLGRKRSFVKSKTLSSIQLGGSGRSVSLSASLSTCTSREGSLLRSKSPDSDGSSLTSLTESPRSSPVVDWTGEAQLGKMASRSTDGSPMDELEILIPASKQKKGTSSKAGKKDEAAIEAPGTPKGSRTGTAPNTPKKTTPKSPSKKAMVASTQDSKTPTKAASASKKAATPKKETDEDLEATPKKSKATSTTTKSTNASKKATKPKAQPAPKARSSASPTKKTKAVVKTAATSKVKKAAGVTTKKTQDTKSKKMTTPSSKATAKPVSKKPAKKSAASAPATQQTALNFVPTAAPNKAQTKAAGVQKGGSKGKGKEQQGRPVV
ncbi:hypothetical protein OC861_001426 [Tilletia horrida]|nr:hypothetical protein OC861_001426 [Tilletia horrida]